MASRGAGGVGSWRGIANRTFSEDPSRDVVKSSESGGALSSSRWDQGSLGKQSTSASHTSSASSWRRKGPWSGKESKQSGSEREREGILERVIERDEQKERRRKERFGLGARDKGEKVRKMSESGRELDWGFVSKGDARLLDRKNQEKFFAQIVDRYMQFCGEHAAPKERYGNGGKDGGKRADRNAPETGNAPVLKCSDTLPVNEDHAKRPDHAFSTTTTTSSLNALTLSESKRFTEVPSIGGQHVDTITAEVSALLLGMRKLREGMLASHRMDQFTKEAYIFFVRAAILLRSIESYLPAIVRLLEVIHLSIPLSNSELSEFAGYYMLHFSCRLEDYSKAFEIRKRYRVRDLRIDQAIRALIHNNYWSFRTARRKVDAYRGVLMDFAEQKFREDTLKCLARAYHVLDVEYVEVVTGCSWEEVREEYNVGWAPDKEGKKVMVRKKPRKNCDIIEV